MMTRTDNGEYRRVTTAELLAELKDKYEHFDPAEWDEGDSAYYHEQLYLMAKDVSETLDIFEIKLIYFLRYTARTYYFFNIAKRLYDAEWEYKQFVKEMTASNTTEVPA